MTDSSEGEDMQFGSNESRMGKKKEAKVKVFLRSLGDMEFVQEI